jgi:hypothetical protein
MKLAAFVTLLTTLAAAPQRPRLPIDRPDLTVFGLDRKDLHEEIIRFVAIRPNL